MVPGDHSWCRIILWRDFRRRPRYRFDHRHADMRHSAWQLVRKRYSAVVVETVLVRHCCYTLPQPIHDPGAFRWLGTLSMIFTQRLKERAQQVDARLLAHLGQIAGQFAGKSGQSYAAPERLLAAMRHAVLGGGKRIRPCLVLECAALFNVAPSAALDTASALELVHCYSLAHDDLPAMDNDEVRRGQPTVWKAFDDWTAILAGDALQTLAFEILAKPATHPNAEVRTELVLALARASGAAGMAGGQALDLEADKLGLPVTPSIDHIRRLQGMKTGALLVFACEAGAILGAASLEQRNALRRYGTALGLAFQIADDLLDAEGDAKTVGKAVAKDAAANKATLVSLMGLEAARAKLADTEREAVNALAPFGPSADVLREAAAFVVRRQA